MNEEIDMNVFRGLAIMLLTIIAYMVIDGLFHIPWITFLMCAVSGILIAFTCRGIKHENLNTFRAALGLGLVFFVIGNLILFKNINSYYYDELTLYTITIGFFLSAVGMIVMFSSIPLIIIKDFEEHRRRSSGISSGKLSRPSF